MTTLPKPIGPAAHGVIDYAFVAVQLLAPSLFDLRGPARSITLLLGTLQGVVNALTDHPLAVRRLIPFKTHGQLELPFVPGLILLPWVTGAFRQANARGYFAGFFLVALTNYVLTDYRAKERRVPMNRVPARLREVVPV
jgi:hypothetical protein